MGHKAKCESFRPIYERYHNAGRRLKHWILKEFCLNTGYHRKYCDPDSLARPTLRCYIGLPHAIEPAVPVEPEFERRSLLIPRKTWPPKPGCPGTDQHLSRGADWLLACVSTILLGSLSLSAQSVALQVESALRKGKQAQEAGDFVAAAQSFEQARRLAPENREAWGGLLVSYLRGEKQAEALAVGEAAVSRWPQDEQFRQAGVSVL